MRVSVFVFCRVYWPMTIPSRSSMMIRQPRDQVQYIRSIGMPFSGYACKFSPFTATSSSQILVASSQFYGIVGSGRVTIFNLPTLQPSFDIVLQGECCFDAEWLDPGCIVAACGSGNIHTISISHPHQRVNQVSKVHSGEVCSIQSGSCAEVLTSSWDHSVSVFNLSKNVSTYRHSLHNSGLAYEAKYQPMSTGKNINTIASVGGDGRVIIADTRSAPSSNNTSMTSGCGSELLCLDWNPFNPFVLATGSVDNSVYIHDIRKLNPPQQQSPLHQLCGHKLAVRRLKWHSVMPNILATAS